METFKIIILFDSYLKIFQNLKYKIIEIWKSLICMIYKYPDNA